MLEDFSDALVRLGRALEVLVGANLLADILTLWQAGQHPNKSYDDGGE